MCLLWGYRRGASILVCCHVREGADRGLGEWQWEEQWEELGGRGEPARGGLASDGRNMLKTLEGGHQGANLLPYGHLRCMQACSSCRGGGGGGGGGYVLSKWVDASNTKQSSLACSQRCTNTCMFMCYNNSSQSVCKTIVEELLFLCMHTLA